MLIKFFPNGKGAGAGPVGYLVAERVLAYDSNRDLIRDADGQPVTVTRYHLPEVLRGNPERTEALIDSSRHQWTYRAGVISFADSDDPTRTSRPRSWTTSSGWPSRGWTLSNMRCSGSAIATKAGSSSTSARRAWS